MDEAFEPFSLLLPRLLPVLPDLRDEEAGVRSYVTGYEIETPLELDVTVEGGRVRIGSTPPIYHVATSSMPVFHSIRVVAVRSGGSDE